MTEKMDNLPSEVLLKSENNNNGESNSQRKEPKNSVFCAISILITMQSTMMPIGISVGSLNPTMTIMSSFCNQTYYSRYHESMPDTSVKTVMALIISMIFVGGLLGALTLSLYSNMFSRKGSMLFLNTVNIIAVSLMACGGYLIPSYEAIIIGRFLMGFVSGASMNMVPMITAETSSKTKISVYLSLIGVFLSGSGLLGLILGYKQILGTNELWPFLMATAAVPSVAYVVCFPWLPQTPYHYLRLSDKKGAVLLLRQLRDNEEQELESEVQEMEHELKFVNQSYKTVSIYEMLSDSGYRKQLLAVLVVFLESQLCGINGISMYTDQIFLNAKIPQQYVTYASTIVYFVQLVAALIASSAVDAWGPRRVCIFWSVVMSVTMATQAIAVALVKQIGDMVYLSVVAVTLYVLAWASGPNVTLFPLVTALTTESTRETCFKFGGGLFWTFSWLISFLPSYLFESMKQYYFVPYCIFNALAAIYFMFYIPETHKRSSDVIQIELRERLCRKSSSFYKDSMSCKSTEI